MITVLIIVAVAVAIFVAGVCESNRVIAAVKASEGSVHDHVDLAVTGIHERLKSIEVTVANRVTAVENSIKAKLP